MWKVLSQGIHTYNMKALSFLVWKLWPRLKFFKSRSNFKVKDTRSTIIRLKFSKVVQIARSGSQGQNLWYHVKGFDIRNTHMKYESFIFNGLKVMAKVKVFVLAANADVDAAADHRAMPLAPQTFVPVC